MRCKVLILGLALLLLTGCIGGGADTNTLTIEIEGGKAELLALAGGIPRQHRYFSGDPGPRLCF